MIIIITKSGEHFVNDKEVINLYHDIDESYVKYTSRADNNRFRINNVMEVTYISDTIQANLTFNGKEFERIYADNADQKEKINELEKRLHDAITESEINKTNLEDAQISIKRLTATIQKLRHTNGELMRLVNTVIDELDTRDIDSSSEHLRKIYSAAFRIKKAIEHPEQEHNSNK